MNRIILVGNGFDLAHGLKTSYCDFIEDYLTDVFLSLTKNNYTYEDPLISIKITFNASSYNFEFGHFKNYTDFFTNFRKRFSPDFAIFINPILQSTLDSILECNWVDLEMAFFQNLCKGIDENKVDKEHVKSTNVTLEYLKSRLPQYLEKVEGTINRLSINPHIVEILTQPPRYNDFRSSLKPGDATTLRRGQVSVSNFQTKVEKTMVVNFNYTSTLEKYIQEVPNLIRPKYQLNYIHGKLKDEANPPIFGFGDEHNKRYLEFEDHNENSLFKHVKSYRYLLSHNNKNLLNFAGSDLFQVFILGHSCGLTDRTLLKSIFENENCRSIKIFHYRRQDGTTDYHEKTIEIGRHFTDKGFMRRAIVDFDKSDFLPQLNHHIVK